MTDELVEKVKIALRVADTQKTGMAAALDEEYETFARAALAAVEASGTHVVAPAAIWDTLEWITLDKEMRHPKTARDEAILSACHSMLSARPKQED